MKTYLCILNGPECRDKITEKAINVSKNYIDNIFVFQNGISRPPSELIRKHTVYSSYNFIDYKILFNLILDYVSRESWFLHIDSDEIPNLNLLKFIKEKVNNIPPHNMLQLGFMSHDIILNKVYTEDVGFEVCRLYKNTDMLQSVTCSKTHPGFINNQHLIYRDVNLNLQINHFKSQESVYLSSLSRMIYAVEKNDANFNELTEEEFDIINKIRLILWWDKSPSVVYKNFDNKELWKEIYKISTPFGVSKCKYLREMYYGIMFIINFDKDISEVNSTIFCDKRCCQYE